MIDDKKPSFGAYTDYCFRNLDDVKKVRTIYPIVLFKILPADNFVSSSGRLDGIFFSINTANYYFLQLMGRK